MVKQKKGVKEDLIMSIKNVETKSNIPTPEQMRIAQILDKKLVDSTIKLKLKQIMDATQRSADEVYVALHDSDFDVNRAVNLLIEGEDQLSDWCTNEKRKKRLAELKEKKEEGVDAEAPLPEKTQTNLARGRGDKRRTGRRQDGRQPKTQEESKKQASSEPRAPRGKRPGFGSMVFERSNPPPVTAGILPPVKNQWEKPLLKANGPEDDWDCEEFQGSLSQTLIFPSSKRPDPQEVLEELKMPKAPSPRLQPLSSLTFTNKAHDPDSPPKSSVPAVDTKPQERAAIPPQGRPSADNRPCTIPSQDRPGQDRGSLQPDSRADLVYKLCLKYAKPSHHEDKRPPSKIPTLPVEMPPELKPSLSFLDIEFGAMDLSETSSESQSNHSSVSSLNPSATTLVSPQSLPSSCSVSNLMAKASSSNVPGNINPANSSSLASATNSPVLGNNTNPPGLHNVSCPPGMNAIPGLPGINSIASPPGLSNASNSISNPGLNGMNTTLTTAINQSLNSISNTVLSSIAGSSSSIASMSTPTSIVNMVPPSNISGSIGHHMGQSSVQAGTNMGQPNSIPNMVSNTMNHTYASTTHNQSRFMPSSQGFNGSHLQYGIINPPVTTHGYDSRDNPPPAPPHMPQPHGHLPPFKSPPGVPKGSMVPNLPPGPLVGNQYLVGQGNVPYFPHPPIYYYEEVQPVINSQQRLTNMGSHSHHYDVSYQSAPSTRDSVHYNV